MPAKVTVSGLDQLDKNVALLRRLPYTEEAKKVFMDAGRIVRDRARDYAPFDSGRKKGTHLRDAILVSPGPKSFPDVLVTVRYRRPGAPHAHLVEFGTVKMAARPFLRPAVSATRLQVQAQIKREFLQLIKETPK
jgi:HK97 gp10 family phage protein